MLRNFLSYKTNLVKVPAAYTSQTCHKCGIRNSKLTLEDRGWTCPNCGSHHDRDINAAINIKISAISRLGTYRNQNACGEPSSSTKQENLKPFVQNKKSSAKGRVFAA
jgi:transposase